MVKCYLASLLLVSLVCVLPPGSPSQAEVPPLTLPGAVPGPAPGRATAEPSVPVDGAPDGDGRELKDAASPSSTTARLVGNWIEIAVSAAREEAPAVAQCASGQYLVVYECDDVICGQRLESDGELLGGSFVISTDTNRSVLPDVACDWYNDRFLVVYQYDYNNNGTDWDVRARGVLGQHQSSGSQLYGTEKRVSQDASVQEITPAVACNIDDHSCLVVFHYHTASADDIYAQRMSVGTSDISNEGTRFTIGTYAVDERFPDVAWGGYDDDYAVVWQYLYNGGDVDHYRILVSYVWDTNQAGSQIQAAPAYLIGPGSYDRNQERPAAAYNRFIRQFLVAFDYDYYGDGRDYDIKAMRLTPGGGSVGGLFSIASSGLKERYPRVAFSGGEVNISGGTGANQFLVTYETISDYILHGQAVKGTYDASGSQLVGEPVTIGADFGGPEHDLTGSALNGRYLAVWDASGDGYRDVLGQMVAPYAAYLPLILRHSP